MFGSSLPKACATRLKLRLSNNSGSVKGFLMLITRSRALVAGATGFRRVSGSRAASYPVRLLLLCPLANPFRCAPLIPCRAVPR